MLHETLVCDFSSTTPAIRTASEVAIMDAGKIVAQGSPAELKASIGTDVITMRIEGGPDEFARATRRLVDSVARRAALVSASAQARSDAPSRAAG